MQKSHTFLAHKTQHVSALFALHVTVYEGIYVREEGVDFVTATRPGFEFICKAEEWFKLPLMSDHLGAPEP
ncbi:uncharacterized protein PHALS_05372 [Plasmopara halstedii]|uniref:Uncharacterized protein n=1 Tax=Plasmopara halstedii TaxID=4781 RepID=A0A0P1AB21_PLAHL|nr:uncharacterized protein PHALS_05372 [Plasmopara halstedii]CEG37593.1 hypothetical protein PHALS_05372 [Plasmopara halstedii]|eukprot:XP_024573962.1 hypothetical protein PHALS_05372 [Plasmopara halstedii]